MQSVQPFLDRFELGGVVLHRFGVATQLARALVERAGRLVQRLLVGRGRGIERRQLGHRADGAAHGVQRGGRLSLPTLQRGVGGLR